MNVNNSIVKDFCKTNPCALKKLFATVSNVQPAAIKPSILNSDKAEISLNKIRKAMLETRDAYLQNDNAALLTLIHVKDSCSGNEHVWESIHDQNTNLDAVSVKDFCNLSEIMKKIRTPERLTVYRAMEGNDFHLGRIKPEDFLNNYYRKGKVVTVPQYSSTSLDPNVAFRFAENNPYRLIIKLDVPEGTPAVYMEGLTPHDVHENEDELCIIRNVILKFGDLRTVTNPLNGKSIFELEGTICGFRDISVEPEIRVEPDAEMIEFMRLMRESAQQNNQI